jgi:integrase/recombinase XerD
MNTLGTLVVTFFRNHLVNEKGVRPNTIASYSDCARLLLDYTCRRLGVDTDKLPFDAIDDQIILDFLDHLETQRDNVASTRNQRLAAIKTFFRFLARHQPTMLAACERVCAIKAKNVSHKVMETLADQEVKAIFNGLTCNTVHDARDRALLNMMYNTGARVQELLDLDSDAIRLDAPFQVKFVGKGDRERIIPLHKETVDEVARYLQMRRETGKDGDALFLNDRGERLSRHGVIHIVKERVCKALEAAPSLAGRKITPHTFRHTLALHLIQAGVDITVVKEWLGHADIKTTAMYVEINIEMKRKALEACPPPSQPEGTDREMPNWKEAEVMKFLRELSKAPALC